MSCGCNERVGSQAAPIIAGLVDGRESLPHIIRMSYGNAKYGDVVWVTGSSREKWAAKGLIEETVVPQ